MLYERDGTLESPAGFVDVSQTVRWPRLGPSFSLVLKNLIGGGHD
jgi:hypothetical protein